MYPNSNPKHFRLKAAQRDLIAAAGGIERAACVCGYSKSVVGRWANIDAPEIMQPTAIDLLEAETGRRDWTAAWLESRGLKLAGETSSPIPACLTSEMSGFVTDFGALLAEWGVTAADGRATPVEADRLLRQLAKLLDRTPKMRDALAAVIADGGRDLNASLRVVGE